MNNDILLISIDYGAVPVKVCCCEPFQICNLNALSDKVPECFFEIVRLSFKSKLALEKTGIWLTFLFNLPCLLLKELVTLVYENLL